MKHLLIIMVIGMLFFGVAACGVNDSDGTVDELPYFTLEELAANDGIDGRPIYVAVDGVVYDVSDLPQWQSGSHNGFQAGQDLSEAINAAPHGKSVLSRATEVGQLKD